MSKNYYEPKPEFIERMKFLLKDEKDIDTYFKIIKTDPPRSIRCNTIKISPNQLKKRLEKNYNWKLSIPFKNHPEIMIVEGKISDEENISIKDEQTHSKNQNNDISNSEKSWQNHAKVVNINENLLALSPGELGRSLEHLLGYYYVQEIASMLPAIVLNPNSSEKVLDLCASPGSKTTQIASMMNNSGLLVANEISMGRLTILTANTSRCGVSNVIVTKKDGNLFCKFISENMPDLKFDKILVDAPCSGEGTIRSTPSTNKMWNPHTIKTLKKLQKHLLESSLEILKVGGELVYSTCTHAPEENEEVLNYILTESKWKDKVEMVGVGDSLPKELKTRPGITEWKDMVKKNNAERFRLNSKSPSGGGVGEVEGIYEIVQKKFSSQISKACRIYPQDNDTEGFFISKLKKVKE